MDRLPHTRKLFDLTSVPVAASDMQVPGGIQIQNTSGESQYQVTVAGVLSRNEIIGVRNIERPWPSPSSTRRTIHSS